MSKRYRITLDEEVAREFEEQARKRSTSAAIEIRRFLTKRYHDSREQDEALRIAERMMLRHDNLFRRLAKVSKRRTGRRRSR